MASGLAVSDPSVVPEVAVRLARQSAWFRRGPAFGRGVIAAHRQPSSLELVTLDDRLATAARKEGFPARVSWFPRRADGTPGHPAAHDHPLTLEGRVRLESSLTHDRDAVDDHVQDAL